MDLMPRLEEILAAVRAEFAPDPRESIFELELAEDGDAAVVVGVTSEAAAAEALQHRLGRIEARRPIRVKVVRLPLAEEPLPHALCVTSVAPMQSGPFVSDPYVSQTVAGHRLLVYREHGRWLQCRSEDGYLGWIHRGYLRRVDESEARGWESGTDGQSCMSLEAVAIGDDGRPRTALPWGAMVIRLDDGRVRLPDGREARVEGELVPESERRRRFPLEGERVVETAQRWCGVPYVWGGITRAGVDCSGLAQAVYRTHGLQLPRDSDLQARVGRPVEPGVDFSDLRPGDLLYFVEEAGRISHVAISMGGPRVIHASLGNGGVGMNDLTGDSGFEEELRRLFVCARRVIPT